MPNEKKSILQPKNDVVYKALFSRGKPRITQAMLEAILKMKIDKLELDNSINSQAVDHLSEAQQQVEQLMKNNNMVNEDIKGIEIDLNF